MYSWFPVKRQLTGHMQSDLACLRLFSFTKHGFKHVHRYLVFIKYLYMLGGMSKDIRDISRYS